MPTKTDANGARCEWYVQIWLGTMVSTCWLFLNYEFNEIVFRKEKSSLNALKIPNVIPLKCK